MQRLWRQLGGGGGLIRTVEMIYDKGLWYIMLAIGGATVYTLLCTVVASRIGAFMEDHISSNNHLSMADTMGRIYGKTPRIITACANVAATAVSVAAQITVTSKALQICVSSVNPTMLIVISASIVILYSTLWLALLLGCSYPVGYFTENFLGSLDVNIRGKQLE